MIGALVAAITALILVRLSRSGQSSKIPEQEPTPTVKPPVKIQKEPQPAGPKAGAAIFWAHKTPAGFECVGYCDDVRADANNITFYNARIIDLTIKTGGIFTERRPLIVPINNLGRLETQSMGGHVLYHLTAGGILDDGAGAMLFPSNAVRIKLRRVLDERHKEGGGQSWGNWLLTLPNRIVDWVGELITTQSITFDTGSELAAGAFLIPRRTSDLYQVRGSKWSTYWQRCAWPVNVEINAAGIYYAAPVGER